MRYTLSFFSDTTSMRAYGEYNISCRSARAELPKRLVIAIFVLLWPWTYKFYILRAIFLHPPIVFLVVFFLGQIMVGDMAPLYVDSFQGYSCIDVLKSRYVRRNLMDDGRRYGCRMWISLCLRSSIFFLAY